MDRPIESETCKIVENSYRATTLAFMHEWSLFAERNGVDLPKIVEAIKVRPTHSNMIFPGPGIGGYCLPKDGGLGVWSYHTLMGFEDDIFKITPLAIDINDTRALHVAGLVRDGLRNQSKIVAASRVLILGPMSNIGGNLKNKRPTRLPANPGRAFSAIKRVSPRFASAKI